MNKRDERTSLSKIRQNRNRLECINRNRNGKISTDVSPRYRRNYVRFRKNSSRSRSRDHSKFFHLRSSINYRKKLILFILQIIALLHLCSVIYCHQKQSSFTVKYTIITLVFFNF